jgi:hypothetical protein
VKAFFLKLVGRHPDQMRERRRFDENIRRMEEKNKELEDLLEKIRETDEAIQSSEPVLLASQYPPSRDEDDTHRDE